MNEPSDPKRLVDVPSSELGRLMASAERDLPSDQELAALAERLGSVLGPVHGAASVPRGSSLLAKLGVVTGLAVLIGAGLFVARKQPGQAASPSVVPSLASAVSKAPPEVVTRPAPVAAAPPASAIASAASSASAPVSSLSNTRIAAEPSKSGARAAGGPSEPALLEQARRVLASDPAAALALTAQAATLFPHGILAQEREVIAIEALRRLNRRAEADRRAAAFAKAFPGSVHQRAVEDASPK